MVRLSVFESDKKPIQIGNLAIPEPETHTSFDFQEAVKEELLPRFLELMKIAEPLDACQITFTLTTLFPELKQQLTFPFDDAMEKYTYELDEIKKGRLSLQSAQLLDLFAFARPFVAQKVDRIFENNIAMIKASNDMLSEHYPEPGTIALHAARLLIAYPSIVGNIYATIDDDIKAMQVDIEDAIRDVNAEFGRVSFNLILRRMLPYRIFTNSETTMRVKLSPQEWMNSIKIVKEIQQNQTSEASRYLFKLALAAAEYVGYDQNGLFMTFPEKGMGKQAASTEATPPVQRNF